MGKTISSLDVLPEEAESEEIEAQEDVVAPQEEVNEAEQDVSVEEPQPEEAQVDQPEPEDTVTSEPDATNSDEDAEAAKKEAERKAQENYRERLERKRQKQKEDAERAERERLAQLEAARIQAQQPQLDESEINKQKMRQVDALLAQQQMNAAVQQAQQELQVLETDYSEAFADYKTDLDRAVDITKRRLVHEGMSEAQAMARIEREKLITADAAAGRGEDPVEALHKEAKMINGWIDSMIEEMGYIKADEKKTTNVQAIKEASKASAVGAGRGTAATTKDINDMDKDEVDELSLADFGMR